MRTRTILASIAVSAGLIAAPVTGVVAPAAAAPTTVVTQALNTLEVKGRAPKTGYDRAQFGQAWTDDVTVAWGRNGCDTRNDVLRRDLDNITLRPGSNGCTVMSGTLKDPYTGSTIVFTRGANPADVQIDHMVALSDAWQKGAQQWSAQKRKDFANDPLNLQAVSGKANQQKGAGDAATWLPANKAYRCEYVARQVAVKKKYGLAVTAAEKQAIERVLSNCSEVKLHSSAFNDRYNDQARPAPQQRQQPRQQEQTRPQPVRPQAPQSSYSNCSQARAAGVTPIYRGQPGYSPKLDRDGDGVACE
ncbi:GmrSD restriction endonuclease domain-containing protein [Gordonia iterans]